MAAKTSDWRPGPAVCRCCLAEGCYKDISTEYFWMGKREVYSEMLSDTFDITISYSKSSGPNSNSRLICEPCISRLRDASEFKKQVQDCEKTFMQHLDPGSANVSFDLEPLSKEVKLEQVKQEARVSDDDFDNRDLDDDDDDELDNQPLTKLATKVPKKESVDLLDLLDNAKVAEKRKATTKTKAPPPKKTKVKPSSSKPVPKPAPKPEKKKKGPVDLKLRWNPKRKYKDQRDNAAIILECSNVCPFRWKRGVFVCAYCPFSFGDFSEIQDHIPQHSARAEALRLVRQVNPLKVEISNLRCELCFENTADLETLKDHLISVHQKPITKDHGIGLTPYLVEGKEFVCPHCSERFNLFSKLNSHMNQHYQNNICFECGKGFAAVHRLMAHLAIHETSKVDQYKCSECDKKFATKVLRNYHVAVIHRSQYRYKCPYCEVSFKRYGDRLKHLKESHDWKIEYPCHMCTAVFSLCNQRTKHIKQVHIKHKQFSCALCSYQFVTAGQLRNHMVKHVGERKYQCEVCKKSYPRMKSLKEHMRIHNNDRRFVCEHCNSAFIQKCSLKCHVRNHHSNIETLKKAKVSNVHQ